MGKRGLNSLVKRGENIYKRKDNRWEGRYIKSRNPDGTINYGYLYEKNYTVLKRKLLLKKAYYHENYALNSVPKDVLFLFWAEYYIAKRRNSVKASTYTSYRYKLDHYILPYLGNTPINSITTIQIETWKKQLENILSISSIKVVFQLLRSCLDEAVYRKFIQENPCNNCNPIKQFSIVNDHITREIHDKLKHSALLDKRGLAIVLALESGMRIGEIAGLKWRDISLKNSVLTVQRTIQRIPAYDQTNGKKTILVEGSPKSKSSYRTIPISSNMKELLASSFSMSKGEYVFGSDIPAEPRKISKWLKRICQSNGIEDIHFHELRHSFANRCLENGVNITTISELLGHKSVKMTLDIYTNSYLSDKREAIDMISK